MTVPMAIDSYGMPVGIEFVGRCYDEGAVIGAGYDFEQALGLEIETTLAPPLYEISDEISDLLELAEQPVFGQIRGYEKEYDDVLNAYKSQLHTWKAIIMMMRMLMKRQKPFWKNTKNPYLTMKNLMKNGNET